MIENIQTKNEAGIRTIPMLDIVKDAFEKCFMKNNWKMVLMKQKFMECQDLIRNRFETVPNPQQSITIRLSVYK